MITSEEFRNHLEKTEQLFKDRKISAYEHFELDMIAAIDELIVNLIHAGELVEKLPRAARELGLTPPPPP